MVSTSYDNSFQIKHFHQEFLKRLKAKFGNLETGLTQGTGWIDLDWLGLGAANQESATKAHKDRKNRLNIGFRLCVLCVLSRQISLSAIALATEDES